MKKMTALFLILTVLFTGCQSEPADSGNKAPISDEEDQATVPSKITTDGVQIVLHDEETTVDSQPISLDSTQAVYAANDIVYYPTGQDFTFGEGTEDDAHEASEAERHTVIHITQPGVYALTGQLSAGQVAIDLGEDADEDPNAVVTLILNGAEITCTVAPAVIFYRVYECGDKDRASETVDTTAAGANVLIADGSVNNISGAYVAKIYKPDTVERSDDGTEVEDAEKLHKYDAAFYSKMSMNIGGNDGVLNITAENEGLDSELHLTINGGVINITSGNDGINTNEDGVSVTTINGGHLTIAVTGTTGEGDGIDSNGWLVINGGTVTAAACAFSGDAGIDSDMGIFLKGGTVIATGNMLDRIAGGDQTYAVFTFTDTQAGGGTYTLRNSDGETAITLTPVNDFFTMILAGDQLKPGDYTFYHGELALEAVSGQSFGDKMPDSDPPEPPDGTMPIPMDPNKPESDEKQPQDGMEEDIEKQPFPPAGDASSTFTIVQGANHFSHVSKAPSAI